MCTSINRRCPISLRLEDQPIYDFSFLVHCCCYCCFFYSKPYCQFCTSKIYDLIQKWKIDGYDVTISIRSDPSSISFNKLSVSGSWAIKRKSSDAWNSFNYSFVISLICANATRQYRNIILWFFFYDVSFIPVPFTIVQLCFSCFSVHNFLWHVYLFFSFFLFFLLSVGWIQRWWKIE